MLTGSTDAWAHNLLHPQCPARPHPARLGCSFLVQSRYREYCTSVLSDRTREVRTNHNNRGAIQFLEIRPAATQPATPLRNRYRRVFPSLLGVSHFALMPLEKARACSVSRASFAGLPAFFFRL